MPRPVTIGFGDQAVHQRQPERHAACSGQLGKIPTSSGYPVSEVPSPSHGIGQRPRGVGDPPLHGRPDKGQREPERNPAATPQEGKHPARQRLRQREQRHGRGVHQRGRRRQPLERGDHPVQQQTVVQHPEHEADARSPAGRARLPDRERQRDQRDEGGCDQVKRGTGGEEQDGGGRRQPPFPPAQAEDGAHALHPAVPDRKSASARTPAAARNRPQRGSISPGATPPNMSCSPPRTLK